MFKYWKEMRELKRTERELKVILLGKLYDLSKVLDNVNELIEMAKNINGTTKEKSE